MPNGYAVAIADVNKRNLLHLVSLDVSCVLQQKNVCEFRSQWVVRPNSNIIDSQRFVGIHCFQEHLTWINISAVETSDLLKECLLLHVCVQKASNILNAQLYDSVLVHLSLNSRFVSVVFYTCLWICGLFTVRPKIRYTLTYPGPLTFCWIWGLFKYRPNLPETAGHHLTLRLYLPM